MMQRDLNIIRKLMLEIENMPLGEFDVTTSTVAASKQVLLYNGSVLRDMSLAGGSVNVDSSSVLKVIKTQRSRYTKSNASR
jgi:hypothetical protein